NEERRTKKEEDSLFSFLFFLRSSVFRRSAAVRAGVVGAGTVVGRFLRNSDVMRMTLLHRRRAHLDEARLGAQLLDVPGPTIPHAGPKPADELVDERRQVALVRHAALDAL